MDDTDTPVGPEIAADDAPNFPSKVDPVDMQKLEMYHLKIQNLELHERLIKADLEKAGLMKRNMALEANMFFQAWKVRYGFDALQEKNRLAPDGTIRPEQK